MANNAKESLGKNRCERLPYVCFRWWCRKIVSKPFLSLSDLQITISDTNFLPFYFRSLSLSFSLSLSLSLSLSHTHSPLSLVRCSMILSNQRDFLLSIIYISTSFFKSCQKILLDSLYLVSITSAFHLSCVLCLFCCIFFA